MKKGETMSYLDRVQQATQMSRRGFVATTAAATAALAATSLAGCSTNKVEKTEEPAVTTGSDGRDIIDGEWKAAACWHNCGGRCVNKVLVKDGVAIRQKTDDTHEDSPDYPQQRACLRGRAQRKQVFAADRIKYPMKRKNWSPDNPNGDLRGIDEWERISWDEALDYVAEGLKKAKEQYGNRSIFAEGTEIGRTLNLFGGYTSRWGTGSLGAFALTPHLIGFDNGDDSKGINDRLDMRNCDTVIMIGTNPAWSSAGSPSYNFLQVKKAGAKFIGVDPFYNETYALLDADWIPCRPSQDTALLLGVAYTLITEDKNGSLIDQDFLDKYCIGFDADHMPEGTDAKENFKDYVLGTYDGVPKSPEWAAEHTGASADQIRNLAYELDPKKNVALLAGWAPARTHNADNFAQILMTIGAMTGHIGKPGNMTGVSCHNKTGNHGPSLVTPGKSELPKIDAPVDDCINDTQLWDAILNGTYNYTGTKPNGNYTQGKGETRDIDIHVIWHANRALLQSRDNMAVGIEAHRKVDMAVCHCQFLTTTAKYCDILLPINTYWERPGGFLTGNREMAIVYSQVIDSMYESHSDQWIALELAKKLGIDPDAVYPKSEKQQFFDQLLSATTLDEDGKTSVPLVTVTQDDIKAWECEGTPQTGKIALNDLIEAGVYQVPRSEGDNYGFIAYKSFIDDPEANPLEESESGKFEIYSSKLAETINGMGYSSISPIPTFIEPVEGYEETFADFDAKAPGDYPYQVINPHYLRRSHTVFDNIPWLREAWENPVFLNAKDATEKSIVDGDTVKITSKHGSVLRKAITTQRLTPGVIGLPHGAWVNVDEKTGIDQAGADNYLCGGISTGQGVSGWNGCIANLEKWTGEAIPDDSTFIPNDYIEEE